MADMTRLTTKLPGFHVLSGLAFFGLGMIAKENLSQNLGMLPQIQLPCAFFSAVLVPLGSLLAIRAAISGDTRPRTMLTYHTAGILFGIAMLCLYFASYYVMSKVRELPVESVKLLPKMIGLARSFPKETGRRTEAEYAFRLYGVIIPYRLDDQRVVDYEPTADDNVQRQLIEKSDRDVSKVLAVLNTLEAQYPYLFYLYAGTYFATFTAGWIWLCVRMPHAGIAA